MSKKRANGENSIFQMKDGRWAVEGYISMGPGRLPQRKRRSARTRAAAIAAFKTLEQQAAQGLQAADDPALRTVGGWCGYWLDEHETNLKPKTRVGYRYALTKYIQPNLGRLRLDDLTTEHVESLYRAVTKAGRSRTQVVQIRAVLNQALNEAVRRQHVFRNVVAFARVPRKKNAAVTPLTPDEARAVLRQARADGTELRWAFAILLGLRQGEALGVRWCDIDLEGDAPTLRVAHSLQFVTGQGLVLQEPKTTRSRRALRLPPEIVAMLRQHRVRQNAQRLAAGPLWADRDFVLTTPLGRPVDAANDRKAWIRLLERAEVPYVRVHAARHTTATLLINSGRDLPVVSEVLGHSSVAVTADIYGHVSGTAVHAALSSLSEALLA